MNEKKAILIIDILKNTINVYFDTFFIFYFFSVANYEVIPLAKYYISLYLFVGISFFTIRKSMKNNFKVPYFRIGISLQAIYIALIMLLKEKIINYIYLVGIIKGIADGLYFFPKNILDTEIINNKDRQKFSGIINITNTIIAIIIPLLLGILLTITTYINLGKIFFCFFIIMFITSFYLKDLEYNQQRIETKKFIKLLKQEKNLKYALLEPLLSGLTFQAGVMELIITLFKIYNFKTNLNLGFVDSICALSSLTFCTIFTLKMKKEHFSKITSISGMIAFIALLIFSIFPKKTTLIIYLLTRYSCITSINLIANNTIVNFSNSNKQIQQLKPEFYCARDIAFSISRCIGYITLLIVCLTIGKTSINYVMILPAISILIESIIISLLCKESMSTNKN